MRNMTNPPVSRQTPHFALLPPFSIENVQTFPFPLIFKNSNPPPFMKEGTGSGVKFLSKPRINNNCINITILQTTVK